MECLLFKCCDEAFVATGHVRKGLLSLSALPQLCICWFVRGERTPRRYVSVARLLHIQTSPFASTVLPARVSQRK